MLTNKISKLRKNDVRNQVNQRLKEFSSFQNKPGNEWFSELCFCILTANSKAQTAINIQNELGAKGFCECSAAGIRKCIIKNKHRFHNNKTKYIVEARKHTNIKKTIQNLIDKSDEAEAREWLVKNVKGLGYKEASHFLRNVGYKNLAILDRHILNLFVENNYLKEKPQSLNKKIYLEIEKTFQNLAKKLSMSAAELDLYMWYMKTGKVLK